MVVLGRQFTAFIFDMGHPCYNQLTAFKTRYPPTNATRPYRAVRFRAHQSRDVLKRTTEQELVSIGSRAYVSFTC